MVCYYLTGTEGKTKMRKFYIWLQWQWLKLTSTEATEESGQAMVAAAKRCLNPNDPRNKDILDTLSKA